MAGADGELAGKRSQRPRILPAAGVDRDVVLLLEAGIAGPGCGSIDQDRPREVARAETALGEENSALKGRKNELRFAAEECSLK